MAPLDLQILHYMNSDFDTIYYCSRRVSPSLFDQAPPLNPASTLGKGHLTLSLMLWKWRVRPSSRHDSPLLQDIFLSRWRKKKIYFFFRGSEDSSVRDLRVTHHFLSTPLFTSIWMTPYGVDYLFIIFYIHYQIDMSSLLLLLWKS